MEEVKIKRLKEPIIEIFKDNKFIGICYNEFEFLDLLVQIRKQKSEDFTCKIQGEENNQMYKISSEGRIKFNPYKGKDELLKQLVDF